MLSRLAPLLKCGSSTFKFASPGVNMIRAATASSTAVATKPVTMSDTEILAQLPDNFPCKIEHPERDLVNFPRPKMAVKGGKVRLLLVPEEWFQFFYKKTGVTGPYMLGAGVLTYLFSKELFVVEHEFWNGVATFILYGMFVKKFGPKITAWMDKGIEADAKELDEGQVMAIQNCKDGIEDEKKEQWNSVANHIIVEAKKENVELQLEAEYRRRLMSVYTEVKKRMDYQVVILNAKRQAEHTHMVNWISEQVVKSITPQQENEALKKCFADLKTLATNA